MIKIENIIKFIFLVIFLGSIASIFIYTHIIFAKLETINEFYERRHMQRDEYMASVEEKCERVSDEYLIYAVDAYSKEPAKEVDNLIDEYLPETVKKVVFEDNNTPIIIGSNFPNESMEDNWVCVAVTYPFGKYPIINIQKDLIKESLFHEIGHATEFIVTPGVNASKSADFREIYNEEKDKFTINEYCHQSSQEYFAECFETYVLDPEYLKNNCPKTYDFIDNFIKSINDSKKSLKI